MVKGELLWLPELWNILEIINVFSSFRSTYGQIIPTLHEGERDVQQTRNQPYQVYSNFSEKQYQHKWVYEPHRVTL